MKLNYLILFLLCSSVNLFAQEITVADCTNSSGTAVTKLETKAEKKIAKKAATTVAKKAIKAIVKKIKLKNGASEAEAEQAGTEAGENATMEGAESGSEAAAEAAGEALGEAAAEFGAEVSVELATDPSPIGLATVAVSAAIDAIWESFKENAEGHPEPIYIDIERAKKGAYKLKLPDTYNLMVLATPKAYDTPRIILNHGKNGWWKGLVKFKQNDPSWWEEIVCVTTGKVTSANYLTPELWEDYIVTISYAKDFGAHTNMYSIRNLENFGQDHDWYFIWTNGE